MVAAGPPSAPAGPPSAPAGPPSAPASRSAPPWPTRRGRVIAVRVVGVLLALALLAAGTVNMVLQFFQQRTTQISTITAPVTQLVAGTQTGDIRVRSGPAGSAVQVVTSLRWSFHKPTVEVSAADGVLAVRGRCPDLIWFGGWCTTDFDLTLPAGTTLDVSTGTGDVRVTGAESAVVAESGTGDIDLDLPGSPSVKVDAGSGEITVSSGSPEARLQANAGTGDIRLTLSAAPAEVRAETGTGSIDVRVPIGDSYRVDAETGTGEVTIGVPRNDEAPRRLIVTSGTGDITVRAR